MDEAGRPPGRSRTSAQEWRRSGRLPSIDTVVAERFFDESGGMQLILHAPFGSRINRAWGLALRKRFCRTFNFELQAAATDNGIVISLSEQHAFPLEAVFEFLRADTVEDVSARSLARRADVRRAVALERQPRADDPAFSRRRESACRRFSGCAPKICWLPCFPIRWPAPRTSPGPIRIPDHPLVNETISNCLHEAMDVDGLKRVLGGLEIGRDSQGGDGELRCPRCSRTRSSTRIPMRFWMTRRSKNAGRARCSCEARTRTEVANGILDPAAIDEVSQRSLARSARMPMKCMTRC